MVLSFINGILWLIGLISTVFFLIDIYNRIISRIEEKKDIDRKKDLLRLADYFIAHIIHLGGESSTTCSLQVYSNEDGGYYFNPPRDFVSTSLARSGLTVVAPTDLSSEAGFVIDSIAEASGKLNKTEHRDICHLPFHSSIRNEYLIKFVKDNNNVK